MAYTVAIDAPKNRVKLLRRHTARAGIRVQSGTAVGGDTDAIIVLAAETPVSRRSKSVFVFDPVVSHPAMAALAEQIDAGRIGIPGFVRLRLTMPIPPAKSRPREPRDWARFGLASPVLWGVANLAPVTRVYTQTSAAVWSTARQLLATLSHKDGAITQINVTARPGALFRCETEVVGSEGLLAIDTQEEVAAHHFYYNKRPEGLVEEEAERHFMKQVLAALNDPEHPLHAGADLHRTTHTVLRAAERSVDRGRAVKLGRRSA